MVKAVQKRTQKMAFEPPSRIMKLAGTARYSSQGIYGSSSVPIESLSVTVRRSRVVTRYYYPSLNRETDFFIDRKGI